MPKPHHIHSSPSSLNESLITFISEIFWPTKTRMRQVLNTWKKTHEGRKLSIVPKSFLSGKRNDEEAGTNEGFLNTGWIQSLRDCSSKDKRSVEEVV